MRAARAVVLSLLLLAAVGCSPQAADSNVTYHTGTVYVGESQATIKGDDGWYYAVRSDVKWTDAAGSWHEGTPPSCFPPVGQTARVTFAATEVMVNGVKWRPVVWVSCQG